MRKNKKKPPEANKPSLVLTRKGVIGWLCIIFFLSAWMFSIGVLVGRETFPVKLYKPKFLEKLEAYQGEDKPKESLQVKQDSAKEEDKPQLEFFEILPEEREDDKVPAKPMSQVVAETKKPSPEKTVSEKKDQSPSQTVAPEKKKTKTETATAEKEIAAGSKTEPGEGAFTIQVAAFKNMQDADQMVAKLQKNGYPAYRTIGKVSGKGIWFRVRVGTYKSKAEANDTIGRLRKEGHTPRFVDK